MTYSDAPARPGPGFPRLEWTSLVSQPFTLVPGQDAMAQVDVPLHALSVATNLTLEAGAAYGLGAELGACRWRRDTGFVGGQSFSIDCGGVGTGAQTLALHLGAGALRGRLDLVALVCHPEAGRLPCPAPFPPTTS